MRGGGIGGKGRGGEKGVQRREDGLEGEDFPGKFGKPQTARSDKDLLRPKLETATHSGAITYPSLPLAYAHMCGFRSFSIILIK